ncbi:hypothetical protein JCM3774_006780 [Rhodotorula dairenensis]
MRPAPGLVASLREVISRTAATTSRGGASKLVRPAAKVHPPAAPHHAPGGVRHASTAAPPAAWRAAVELIYAGTFKAVRSSAKVHPGPHSGSRVAPRPSAASPFSTFAQASVRRAPPTHFGPRPRPVAVSGPSQVGLGSARQFSSSGYAVFDNVVANAPLALRALADEGLDQRKWKRVRREISKQDRAAVKGKGKALDSRLLAAEKRADFERFFGAGVSAPTLVASASFTEDATPVTLVLAIDPDFDVPLDATGVECSASTPSSPMQRVLSTELLASFESITLAYSAHAHRLQAIINRLSAAGLLDPEIDASTFVGAVRMSDGFGFEHVGRRVWKVTFNDGFITRSRVEQVVLGTEPVTPVQAIVDERVPSWARKVRNWTGRNSVAAGEGDWWWLVGGDMAATPESLSPWPLATPSVACSTASAAPSVDEEGARLVAATFVLPSPPTFTFNLPVTDQSTTPSPAPSSTGSEDLHHDMWSGFASSTLSPAASDASMADNGGMATLDPAASAWAEMEERYSDGTEDLLSSRDERSGLEQFLQEVEGLQERSSRMY